MNFLERYRALLRIGYRLNTLPWCSQTQSTRTQKCFIKKRRGCIVRNFSAVDGFSLHRWNRCFFRMPGGPCRSIHVRLPSLPTPAVSLQDSNPGGYPGSGSLWLRIKKWIWFRIWNPYESLHLSQSAAWTRLVWFFCPHFVKFCYILSIFSSFDIFCRFFFTFGQILSKKYRIW